ncbi:armadillo-type protein, partial [Chytriomyces sp. MP71]
MIRSSQRRRQPPSETSQLKVPHPSSHSADAIFKLLISQLANNQTLIVMRGALDTLIKIMAASSAAPLNTESCEILCNAVGCLTNLATNDDNKDKIARSGALLPLTELALSDDLRVQRNATGAILNMTHSAENRMHLVAAGAVPVLVRLLNSPDYDVQYYSTTSLSNIAVDSNHRKLLAATEISVTNNLIRLTDSPSLKVQCQATLALRNLASDDFFQLEIVKYNGLTSLHHLLQSRIPQIVLAAVACIRNISIHPANESPIVAANFLPPLLDLLSIDNHEIQCHTMSTIRNLASSDENKRKIFEAGAVEKMAELLRLKDGILDDAVKSEMTACLSILALLDEVKPTLYKSIKYLIRLATTARNMDVKTNAAIAIGNAATNLEDATGVAVFLKYWKDIRKYIVEFLSSSDASLRHIAVWTLVQFVHGNDQLKMKVASDQQLVQVIRDIARELFLEEDASIAGNSLLAGASSAEELSQTLLLELGH